MLMLFSCAFLAGCESRNAYHPPPPPEVQVALPIRKNVTIYSDFTGNTRSSEQVEIRARVTGYLIRGGGPSPKSFFEDGDTVSVDHPLFEIDPRPFQAQLDQAKADLESKKATATRAEAIYNRAKFLVRQNAATQEDVDKDLGDFKVAKADILLSEAKVREAELNLGYTLVKAPIPGRIGRRQVDVGNLIVGDNTLLATITRYDPMYVYFTISETDHQDYLKRRRERPAGTLEAYSVSDQDLPQLAATVVGLLRGQSIARLLAVPTLSAGLPRYPVEIGLAKETGYPHRGYIDFADTSLDTGTGTLQLRGVFKNPPPNYYLAPGFFVRVRVPIGTRANALLVPERALAVDQEGHYVLVVNEQNVVERRKIDEIGSLEGQYRVIDKGNLEATDRVVVEGLQKARPGGKVDPKPASN